MVVSLGNLIAMMRQGLVINKHTKLLLTDNLEARCKIPVKFISKTLWEWFTPTIIRTVGITGTVYSLNLFHNSPLLLSSALSQPCELNNNKFILIDITLNYPVANNKIEANE